MSKEWLVALAYTPVFTVNSHTYQHKWISHLKKYQKGETYCFYQNKRPPGFFWSSVRPSGRCPNRSFERFSIGIHIGPVRGPLGRNPGAEHSEAYLQITSFTRVKGRITRSSLPSVQDPATWVSNRREKRYGEGPRGVSNLANRTLLIRDLLLLSRSPTGVPFLLLWEFFKGSVQSC